MNPVQESIARFQLRRINPFRGLMVDADIWRDAHEYHRDQIRLHHLAVHGWGIVHGLEATVAESGGGVAISPGVAIDPEGNFIVVPRGYLHHIDPGNSRTIYLLLQFSEVPSGPNQPPGDGHGQPTRMLDAYRILERDSLPAGACLELVRLTLDPRAGGIRTPADPANPRPNELDLRFRVRLAAVAALLPAPRVEAAPLPAPPAPAPAEAGPPIARARGGDLTLAVAVHSGDGWNSHLDGLRYLAREVEACSGRAVHLGKPVLPAQADGVDFLYLSGTSELKLGDSDVAGIRRVLERGGVVIGEGCAAGPRGQSGMLRFARSYTDFTMQAGRRLANIERGHALLTARHVFGGPPPGGVASTMLLEDGGLIYSTADYGCAWQGGALQAPLQRGAIRDALEMGVNLALYRRQDNASG